MYKKIRNPNTNKLVNINSNIGKGILNKYITVLNGGALAHRERQHDLHEDEYHKKREIYDRWIDRLDSYSEQELLDPARPTPPDAPKPTQGLMSDNIIFKPLSLDECGLTRAEEDDVSIWKAHYEAGWNDYTFGDPSESQREMYTRISDIEYQFNPDEEVIINKIISAGPVWWRKPGAVHALMIWSGESRRAHFDRVHELIAMWRSGKNIPDQWVDRRKSDVIRQMS